MKRVSYLYYILVIYVLAGAVAIWVTHRWETARPMPDFQHLAGYMTALNRSRQPQMMAIKREIANGPAALAREEGLARADGIPLTFTQVQSLIPPPDENAAPLYRKWHDLLTKSHAKLPPYAEPMATDMIYTPAQIAVVRQFFAKNRGAFQLLNEAARKPYFTSSPTDYKLDDWLREAARDLCTESALLAMQRHYAHAISTQALGFHMARQVASQSGLMNYLVAGAINQITLAGMKQILWSAGPNLYVDQLVKNAIEDNLTGLSIQFALKGEVPQVLQEMDQLKGNPGLFSGYFVRSKPYPFGLSAGQKVFMSDLVDAAEAQFLSVMLQVLPVIDQPQARNQALYNRLATPGGMAGTATLRRDPIWLIYGRFTLDNYDSLPQQQEMFDAQKQVVLATAAVLASRAKNGEFPTDLPETFPDPVNGKPLGYRKEGSDGFVVYSIFSIDPRKPFNGGKPGEYWGPNAAIFFDYPAPPPTTVPKNELSWKDVRL